MNKKKQDNTLILLIVGLIMVACAWKFGYSNMSNKADTIQTEVDALDQTITQRNSYKSNSETYDSDTQKFEKEKEAYLSSFPSEVNSEDVLNLVAQLQNLQSNDDSVPVSIFVTSTTITPATEAYKSGSSNLTGYVENVTLSYQYTSYAGLKRMVDYINSYKERCNVTTLSATYDSTLAGDEASVATSVQQCLSGEINFNMFYVTGDDYSNYEAPKTNEYSFKVTNPFLPGTDGSEKKDTTPSTTR